MLSVILQVTRETAPGRTRTYIETQCLQGEVKANALIDALESLNPKLIELILGWESTSENLREAVRIIVGKG